MRGSHSRFARFAKVSLPALALVLAGPVVASAQTCFPTATEFSYDLLGTASGITTANLSQFGLPSNTQFQGIPLSTGWPEGSDVGNTDTVVRHQKYSPPGTTTLEAQVVLLHLRSTTTVTWQQTGEQVWVHATVNRTPDFIPVQPPDKNPSPLPQPDDLDLSCGTLYINANGTMASTLFVEPDIILTQQDHPDLNTQVDLAYVVQNGHFKGGSDTLSGNGGQWSSTQQPPGYPTPHLLPSQTNPNFWVHSVNEGAMATVLGNGPTGRALRTAVYGLSILMFGMSLLAFRSAYRSGRLVLRPVYLLALACLAWFAAWRAPRVPTITYAQTTEGALLSASCRPPNPHDHIDFAHGVHPAGVCTDSSSTP